MKNKNPKRRMALKMQTKDERGIIGIHGSPFMSRAWELRSQVLKDKVKKQGKPIVKKTSTWVSKRSQKKRLGKKRD